MAFDKEVVDETLKTLGIGAVVPEAYRDLLQPAAREVGSNLLVVAKAISICVAPLSAAVWSFEQIRSWLTVRLTVLLAAVPPERIQEPALHIAGPALLHLHFAMKEEHIRELYARLLASAMDQGTASGVHPAFAFVIQQMDPDEALILNHLSNRKAGDLLMSETLDEDWGPVGESRWISEQFRALCRSAGARLPERADTYLDNLIRLQLLDRDIVSSTRYAPERGYQPLHLGGSAIASTIKGSLRVSSFGQDFIAACVRRR
jgi:hypothetical protein